MIRIFPDDSKEKGYKYDMQDDKYYYVQHKHGHNKNIFVKGSEQKHYVNYSETLDKPHDYEKSKTLGTFYWFWNDFMVFEMSEDEMIAIHSMEELVN